MNTTQVRIFQWCSWPTAALISIVIALLLGGCGDTSKPNEVGKADMCGYTWSKTQPVASIITIRHEPDWRNYPGTCRQFGVRGCAARTVVGDTHIVDILVREPIETAVTQVGSCNVIDHELRHAKGEVHAEAHSYTPQDHTRR